MRSPSIILFIVVLSLAVWSLNAAAPAAAQPALTSVTAALPAFLQPVSSHAAVILPVSSAPLPVVGVGTSVDGNPGPIGLCSVVPGGALECSA